MRITALRGSFRCAKSVANTSSHMEWSPEKKPWGLFFFVLILNYNILLVKIQGFAGSFRVSGAVFFIAGNATASAFAAPNVPRPSRRISAT